MQTDPMSASAGGLSALLTRAREAGGGRGPAPVDAWEPPDCGAIPMRIAADGTWFYMGSPIGREAMVRLFASVLRRDADGITYLVTPVEKCAIQVDDAPFVAVELHVEGAGVEQRLTLRTNVGDIVEAGPLHPLRFEIDPGNAGVRPYLHVRGRLEARLNRAVTHQLMESCVDHRVDGADWVGIWAGGAFFPILPVGQVR
ncbi:MAG: DUF1285 domain-containing protein [Ancalomicrobiaceae bacterium]|nr:DUF1285 domain-containing protein [Ancalomicrobiaceae bacterium]